MERKEGGLYNPTLLGMVHAHLSHSLQVTRVRAFEEEEGVHMVSVGMDHSVRLFTIK